MSDSKVEKKVVWVLILFLTFAGSVVAQETTSTPKRDKLICSDCINLTAKPLILPKPIYSEAARAVKASGKVVVQVTIGVDGKVVEAKVLSGHPLLWKSSEDAALASKYEQIFIGSQPVGGVGIITYNYSSSGNSLQADPTKLESPQIVRTSVEPTKSGSRLPIVNGNASYLPKPIYPKLPVNTCASGKVSVQILIGKNGRVKKAAAIDGNSLLRNSAVKAAQLAKFRQQDDVPPRVIKGIVVYNFPLSIGCSK